MYLSLLLIIMFNNMLGLAKKTVEAWEANTNKPTGPALRIMELLSSKKISLEMLQK